MATHIFKLENNGKFSLHRSVPQSNIHTKLESGVYRIVPDIDFGFLIDRISDSMEVPKSIYGGEKSRRTFDFLCTQREFKTVGPISVGMSGSKGSGKTLLAKRIVNSIISDYSGVGFFIDTSIPTDLIRTLASAVPDSVFLFDEFDKHYDPDTPRGHSNSRTLGYGIPQSELLTILEGSYAHKVTFLFTTNAPFCEYFINRPDRLNFKLDFRSIESDVLDDVIQRSELPPIKEFLLRALAAEAEINPSMGLQEPQSEVIKHSAPDEYPSNPLNDYHDKSHYITKHAAHSPNPYSDFNLDVCLTYIKILKMQRTIDDAQYYFDVYNIPKYFSCRYIQVPAIYALWDRGLLVRDGCCNAVCRVTMEKDGFVFKVQMTDDKGVESTCSSYVHISKTLLAVGGSITNGLVISPDGEIKELNNSPRGLTAYFSGMVLALNDDNFNKEHELIRHNVCPPEKE